MSYCLVRCNHLGHGAVAGVIQAVALYLREAQSLLNQGHGREVNAEDAL